MRRVVVVLAILLSLVPLGTDARADTRLREISFASAALGEEVGVRILLPERYDDPANAARRYPVLFLLHGMGGDEADWSEQGDAAAITAGTDLIVVMPDGGESGFYSNWLQGPQWESFHIGELVPWVDAHYHTIGTRAGRAIAGLSMGGYGALVYAARHPDLFVAVASFSGLADLAVGHVVEATALTLLGINDDARWGPYLTNEVNWRDHNPPDLAVNLRPTSVALFTGNGVPAAGDNPAAGTIEGGAFLLGISAHTRFASAGVQHQWHPHGGTHEWHYWRADLRSWLRTALDLFANPPPPAVGFSYRTAEPSFSVWGWSFRAQRAAREFVELRNVQPSVLTAIGSGRLDVVTAPSYVPEALYTVAVDGGAVTAIRADTAGRLAFPIDLGRSHRYQQYTVPALLDEALAGGKYWTTRVVRISRL